MKWGAILTVVLFILPGLVLGACNITDDTVIVSNTILSANETPCYVTDVNGDGAIIINASDTTLTCNGFQLYGNGTGYGIVSGKDRTAVDSCSVTGYSSDVWFSGNSSSLINSILGTLRLTGGHAWIRNNTMSGLSLTYGYLENNTILENTINGAVSVASQSAGDAPWFRLINNTIVTDSHNAMAIGVATIKPLANAEIIGNKINATASGDSYCIYLYGHDNLIENNELHCRFIGIKFHSPSDKNTIRNNVFGGTTSGKTYRAIEITDSDNNNISSNNFTDVSNAVALEYGSANNFFWNNYFYVLAAGTDASNLFNITKTALTNIIGGGWTGGNWWWDYIGEDTNGDGIGDTNLPHRNDYAPLVFAPYVYEDCNQTFGTLTIEAGRTYNFTNCNVTFGTVTVKQYGKLYIQGSNVYAQSGSWNLNSETKTIIRIKNSQMNDCSLSFQSSEVHLTGSTFDNCAIDISGSNATITDNTMDTNLSISGSKLAAIANNHLVGKSMLLTSVSNADIGYNELDNITIENGEYNSVHDMTLKNLKFQPNSSTAWNLTFNTYAPEIYGGRNKLRDITSYGGLKIFGSDNEVKDSTIYGSVYFPWGYEENNTLLNSFVNGSIYIQSYRNPAPKINLINNTINFTDDYGIDAALYVSGVAKSVISDNKINSLNPQVYDTCIRLEGNENRISGNNFRCTMGMEFGGTVPTEKNNITRNRFEKGNMGIIFDSDLTINNVVWDNYFDNRNDIVFQCNATYLQLNNHWNVTKAAGTNILGGRFIAGNYWHDYMGYDVDTDGIGDTDLPKWRDWLPLTLNGLPANESENKGGYNEDNDGGKKTNETKPEEPKVKQKDNETDIEIPGTNETTTVDIPDNKQMVIQIIITPSKQFSGIHIVIKQLPEKPADVDKQHGAVYQYLKIDKNITNEEIKEVVLSFIVDKKWLEENDIDPDSVKMVRWNEGKWEELPTEKDGEDETNQKYKAKSKGFSYFAVVSNTPEATVTQTVSQSPTGYFIMPAEGTLASAVIAVGALVVYFTRGKKVKKTPKKKKPKKRAR